MNPGPLDYYCKGVGSNPNEDNIFFSLEKKNARSDGIRTQDLSVANFKGVAVGLNPSVCNVFANFAHCARTSSMISIHTILMITRPYSQATYTLY